MKLPTEHIFLMGFKHVGKTSIGAALAQQLARPFIDLDQQLESLYHTEFHATLSCRKIVEQHGQDFFSILENKTLQIQIQKIPAIISLGGATPLNQINQPLLQRYLLIHVLAPQKQVFNRIMATGTPTFFPKNEDPRKAFQRIWQERETVYQQLADFSINNDATLQHAVTQILERLQIK